LYERTMVYRAVVGFLIMGSVEVWSKYHELSDWPQFITRLGILAVLFWQFSIGRIWAKWLIAILIAIALGGAIVHRDSNLTARFVVVTAICISSLIVVLWPVRKAHVQKLLDR